MKTVLGLSVTAAGVGWVLVEGTTPVDDDKFVVRDLDDLVSRCLAAVRGAQSIAASSGRRIDSIGVCWSQDVEEQVVALLAALRTGCPDVRSVRQVTPQESDPPPAGRAERTDLCKLVAGLLVGCTETDAGVETDADDETAFVDHDVICGPGAAQTPAYVAAQAVVTGAAPAEPALIGRPRRHWVPAWTPAASGARLVSAAAVTAVIALFAVGSQFAGTGEPRPTEAALAGSTSTPTAQTTQVVPQRPPTVQPMAAVPEPTPTPVQVSEPPIQLALPQPVAEPPAAVPVEQPVSAEPLAAPLLSGPEVAPAPAAPPAVPEQAAPAAAPVAAPEVLPPAPVEPPPPFWLMPPFVPAPPPAAVAPAPEALAAPVEHLPSPTPAPPGDPVLGALP